VLETPGYCDQHRAVAARDYGRARRSFHVEVGFYGSTRWRTVRAAFLRQYPACVAGEGHGHLVAAVVSDHINPIKDGGERFDWANLQGLCIPCHNRKTAGETARARVPNLLVGGLRVKANA